MAPKAKKEKQLSSTKEASAEIPWRPDLPPQLLNLRGRQSLQMRDLICGGLRKSWRSAQKQKCSSNPKTQCLQLSCSNDQYQYYAQHPQIPSIPFHDFHPSIKYFSLDRRGRISWSWLGTPLWDAKIPFKFATLSSYYFYDLSIMVLTGISRPAFVFCKTPLSTSAAWIKQDCTLLDPYASERQTMIFANAIGFKGKFYALSLQGALVVVEEVDSQFKITGLGKNRAVPSQSSKHFTEFFIESNEEILLIFLVSRENHNIVDDVEVFRLELARLSWVKMQSLGDRALFLGTNCCKSLTVTAANQADNCRRNCVYFTHHSIAGWHEYDMKNSRIESPPWDQSIAGQWLLS